MKKAITVIFILLICGCKAHYKDVSIEPKYSEIIGKTVVTRQEMLLHGYQGVGSRSTVPDNYSLTSLPGFGGNYVLTRQTLPVGTVFRIEKALKCKNCPFGFLEFEIKIEDLELDRQIYLHRLEENVVIKSTKGGLLLNPELFDVLTVDLEQ